MNIKLITPYQQEISDPGSLPIFIDELFGLNPFDENTITFLDVFSKKILADSSINRLPEIAALGFWLRRSNIVILKEQNKHLIDSAYFHTSPIGRVLHVCPANVDTIFMYSLAVSLLMGNKNILRVSNRIEVPSIKHLFGILNSLCESENFAMFGNYINIITYPHDQEISNKLSKSVNARLLWGGDTTIRTFRSFETSPRNKDIVFADRMSLLLVNSKAYLDQDEIQLKTFCKNFFNDCYTFDQLGCSSPQSILFIGSDTDNEACITSLNKNVDSYLMQHYKNDLTSLASLKLNKIVDDLNESEIERQMGSNFIKFIFLKNTSELTKYHSCGAGYFYVRKVETIENIERFNDPKIQTVSYFGLTPDEILHMKSLSTGISIDRIVPLGTALNFNYIWDGYNLFDELSKKVQVI